MKILFLDFDGVLNSGQFFSQIEKGKKPDHYLCPELIKNLIYLLDQVSDLYIVVSSSWRHGRSTLDLCDLLEKYGVPRWRIIDKTPTLRHNTFNSQRGDEIQLWLDQNSFHGTFVIVDDDSDMVHLSKHLVQTNFDYGLTMEVACLIINKLENFA